ncbi:MAG: NAD kinase [Rhodobiaceae bacterium]|jgi:NAD+ kinase|nr:NAD kinase [Rhodobiaceae bacterium]MBT7279594.1 NAD kinase [Rhodobiaceae bacterium]
MTTHMDKKLAFVASSHPEAESARELLHARYQGVSASEADIIIALGGDGLMLASLHEFMDQGKPIFGMHHGSVGFLMNRFDEDNLRQRVDNAQTTLLRPLKMCATDSDGKTHEALAINEVSLLRMTAQAAKLRITIDGTPRMDELICDGAMLATPAGSTAYNLSAHGPILPINSKLLALTPISAFRPRRWRGALLPEAAEVTFTALEADKRPISAVADNSEFRNIVEVSVRQSTTHEMLMLFDEDHSLDERILTEQFMPEGI